MLAVNIGIVLVGGFVIRVLARTALEGGLVFVVLINLLITLYDRYRPVHVARFAAPPSSEAR